MEFVKIEIIFYVGLHCIIIDIKSQLYHRSPIILWECVVVDLYWPVLLHQADIGTLNKCLS